jgi:hypothetical protein
VLNGSTPLIEFRKEGNHWVIGGQTQQGKRVWTDQTDGSIRGGYPETVFVNDKPLKPLDPLSNVTSGTFYFDYAADKIYIADDPTRNKVEAGKLAFAFGGGAKNVTVQNLVVEKYNSPGQHGAIQAAKEWVVQDNEVRLNYGVGVKVLDKGKILGNHVHNNGQMGLQGWGDNILVQGNEIAKNGFWSGIDVGWEGGAGKFSWTKNLVIRDNYSHDNHGDGFWTDIDNVHTLYENNIIVGNTHNGIQHEISYDAIIRNNVLEGNGSELFESQGWLWGSQILLQNSSNVDVYGNRVDMTGANGISLIHQDRGSGEYGPWVTTGNKIHDNVVVSRDTSGRIGGVADYDQNGLLNGHNTWADNKFVMSDGDRFWWNGNYDFANFKAATGESGTLSQTYPDIGVSAGSPRPPCSAAHPRGEPGGSVATRNMDR